MKDAILKNINGRELLSLESLVAYSEGQIVSRTLSQNSHVSITLFAFDGDEEISSHKSKGDAMVIALDGSAEVTIADDKFTIEKGQTIVMPAGIPHAVKAIKPFKMLLIVVFPE